MNLAKGPGKNWKLQPFKGESFGIYFNHPPCFFHRLLQRILLGFKWIRE